jgi:hypothetical protein
MIMNGGGAAFLPWAKTPAAPASNSVLTKNILILNAPLVKSYSLNHYKLPGAKVPNGGSQQIGRSTTPNAPDFR